ncbi:MAG: zinc ribbon domain-containing protein, partial [Candidatus Rokubacteria bacterium]|nr:zinc ribbon domain-containing protein [Candidatus Rokubacteria bacterium]
TTEAVFCTQCGARLPLVCPACGEPNSPGARFCKRCGQAIAPLVFAVPASPPPDSSTARPYTPSHLPERVLASPTAVEGEHKQVTVLFCDLADSTALAERRGPESMHALLNRFFDLALAEVHRYQGTINQFLGDGFMALFGAPIAHEDHPGHAVLAAVAIQRALSAGASATVGEHRVDLRARMGINTGPVVVGRLGDRLRMDYTAIGDTTNLAARLQQIAEPGGILVSESTYQAVAGFCDCEPVGSRPVKGKAESVHA